MEYALVFLAALLVGAVVYGLSLREERGGPAAPETAAPVPSAEPAAPAPPGSIYVPLAPATTTWEHRVTGVLGLIVTVALAGALLAFALYLAGTKLFEAIGEAASNGGVSGSPPVP